jgi:hypothetical protein
VSQEEETKLWESVPYVKIYRYNPKHLYPKLNGYGDKGQRKVWSSGGSTHCTLSADRVPHVCPPLPCQITEIPLALQQYHWLCMSCILTGTLKDNYDVSAGFFLVQFNDFVTHKIVWCYVQILTSQKPHIPASFNTYLVINKCVTAVKVSNFSSHLLRNRSTMDIGVLGYNGIF